MKERPYMGFPPVYLERISTNLDFHGSLRMYVLQMEMWPDTQIAYLCIK